MPIIINEPSFIEAVGSKPKIIEEFVGRVNSNSEDISIARMRSPCGWIEPGQTPDFDEYTLVIRGMLRVNVGENIHDVKEGQAIIVRGGEWVQYSTPNPDGAEYIAICIPAFSPNNVHRDE